MECQCGCGAQVPRPRKFVDKDHQLDWMRAGGARELNALQPMDAKERGGVTSGRAAARSGRLADAGRKGAERAREIAVEWRRRNPDT